VQSKNAWKATLKLPLTDLPMRAKAATRDALYTARCTTELYQRQRSDPLRDGRPFVMHDGPPYANGPVHMGHLLNKVLKDVINRYKLLRGQRVDYVPGWDCHGLPIELKALEKRIAEGGGAPGDALGIRADARALAQSTVAEHRAHFKRWGIMADWGEDAASADVYTTMQPSYEAAQLGVLREMQELGLIRRGFRPVHWSPSSRTALAEAELEYRDDHISTAVHVAFPVDLGADASSSSSCGARLAALDALSSVAAVVWTTTPWTLPANMGVAVHPNLEYSVVADATRAHGHSHFIVASALVGEVCDAIGVEGGAERVVMRLSGSELVGLTVRRPLCARPSPVIVGSHVTDDAGTGLVHTAPAYGVEDFGLLDALGVEAEDIVQIVDDGGLFTAEAGDALVGRAIHGEGTDAVLALLGEVGERGGAKGGNFGKLIAVDRKYSHRYPYDWRTKKPVISRATKQWFANVEALHEGAIAALDDVAMVPPVSSARLRSMLEHRSVLHFFCFPFQFFCLLIILFLARLFFCLLCRSEWCISRQRAWGVPIPEFYHASDVAREQPLMTAETTAHVEHLVAEHGSDCWWELPIEKLLPREVLARVAASGSGAAMGAAMSSGALDEDPAQWARGDDTLDVWFDSGTSWAGVLGLRRGDAPADLYLEGSDQHRGWFQSSLLTSVAVRGAKAPFKRLVTHGFVLDAKGRKMSKSIGNVVDPAGEVEKVGADVLRCWAASCDFTRDMHFSKQTLAKASDSLRKVRNTARFLLGNLHDYDGARDRVPFEEMLPVDQYLMASIANFGDGVAEAYERVHYSSVLRQSVHFATNDLSSFWCKITKDRLYADSAEVGAASHARRSAQSAAEAALAALLAAFGPIAPYMAEDVHAHWPNESRAAMESAFDAGWAPFDALRAEGVAIDDATAACWATVRSVHGALNKSVEEMRQENVVGGSDEAHAAFFAQPGSTVCRVRAVECAYVPVRLCSFCVRALWTVPPSRHSAAPPSSALYVGRVCSSARSPLSFPLPVNSRARSLSHSHCHQMFASLGSESLATALGVASVELRHCAAPALLAPRPAIDSGADIATDIDGDGSVVALRRASGSKCGRCWRMCSTVVADAALCSRCEQVIEGMEL
jgi:isoleucyl-tRNA synthetase